MSPLPLLNLPFGAQRAITRQMDLSNILSLSLLSKKCKRVLEIVKFKVEDFTFIFHNKRYSLSLDNLAWYVGPSSDTIKNCKIDGSLVNMSIDAIGECYRYVAMKKYSEDPYESRLELLEKMTKHLLSFLTVDKFRLDVDFGSNVDLIKLFIWKHTRKFDKISINENTKYIKLFPEEVKFILEDLTINELSLDFYSDRDFKYPRGSSKIQKITIGEQGLKYFDDFLSLDCKQMIYPLSNIRLMEIIQILRQWMSGRNEKLEYFEMKHKILIIDQGAIFDGTNATPTVFPEEQLKNRFLALDDQGKNPWQNRENEEAPILMDIEREHDGCPATVILWDKIVTVMVWNEEQLNAMTQ